MHRATKVPDGAFGTLALAMLIMALVAASAGGEWAGFRKDYTNSGSTSGELPTTSLPLWMNDTQASITSTATIVGNMVFYMTEEEEVIARSVKDGTFVWNRTLGDGRANTADFTSSPTYYKGRVYVGTVAGLLYCLDSATGFIVWWYDSDGEIKSSPIVVNDMVLFGNFGSSGEGCNLFAVDLSGKLAWKSPVGSYIYATPASDGARVFITSCDRNVRAFDLETGQELWHHDTGMFITSSPAVSGSSVIVGNHNGTVFSFDTVSGDINWRFVTKGLAKVETSPSVSGDTVVFGDSNGRLYNLDSSNGRQRWNLSIGSEITSSPVIVNDSIVVCDSDGDIGVYRLADGSGVWIYPSNLEIVASPAVSDGLILIGSTNGIMYCFGDEVTDPGNGGSGGGGGSTETVQSDETMLNWIITVLIIIIILIVLVLIMFETEGRR